MVEQGNSVVEQRVTAWLNSVTQCGGTVEQCGTAWWNSGTVEQCGKVWWNIVEQYGGTV